SSPPGINCTSGSCSAPFTPGSPVILIAAPANNSNFAGWSGNCTGSSASTTVTMLGDKTCVATFSLVSEGLTVTKSGAGSGTVTSSPSGISCGSTCSFPFAVGTAVALTPTPAGGSTFAGWSGDCNSSGSVTLTDTGERCTATFNRPGTVTVIKSGNGSGDVI